MIFPISAIHIPEYLGKAFAGHGMHEPQATFPMPQTSAVTNESFQVSS
jgi:hypothetical protein